FRAGSRRYSGSPCARMRRHGAGQQMHASALWESNPAGGQSGRLASAAVPTACAAPGSPMSQRTHKPQQAASADAGTATGTAKQTSTGPSAAVATLKAAEAARGPFPVVGLGASAGGLIALRAFLEHMPASSGMAFVVILHLS